MKILSKEKQRKSPEMLYPPTQQTMLVILIKDDVET